MMFLKKNCEFYFRVLKVYIILVLTIVYHVCIILPFPGNICILKGLYFILKQSRQTLIKNSVNNISNWVCYNGYIFFA